MKEKNNKIKATQSIIENTIIKYIGSRELKLKRNEHIQIIIELITKAYIKGKSST